MGAPEEFRDALVEGDFRKLRRIWSRAQPHLPQPADDAEAEALMHRARTEAQSVPFRMRAYSHRWLTERCVASGLPMELRPSAERMVPKVVQAVGIAVKFGNPLLAPAGVEVRRAMEVAVHEADADGKLGDSKFVKARMDEARVRTMKKLFGNFGKAG